MEKLSLDKKLSLLSEVEREAYDKAESYPPLSPVTAAKFFGLFLQGYGCMDIARTNPEFGALALGLIVRARIDYDWDTERDLYIRTMMELIRVKTEKATLEGIQFASDGMAVFHKLVGDRFRKFIQTGNEEELGEFKHMSFKMYKEFVQIFTKLTGKDQIVIPNAELDSQDGPKSELKVATSEDKPVSAETAEDMFKLLSSVKVKS